MIANVANHPAQRLFAHPRFAKGRIAVGVVATALAAATALSGCSSGKHKAVDTTSGPSGLDSASASAVASGGSSGPASGSASASVSGDTAAPSGGAGVGSGGANQPATLPQAQIEATASKTGLSVRAHAGQVLRVTLPPPAQQPGQTTKYDVTPAGVLAPIAGAPGFYTAQAPGTAKILVTQTPTCPKGSACPAHVVEVGTLTVTVWK